MKRPLKVFLWLSLAGAVVLSLYLTYPRLHQQISIEKVKENIQENRAIVADQVKKTVADKAIEVIHRDVGEAISTVGLRVVSVGERLQGGQTVLVDSSMFQSAGEKKGTMETPSLSAVHILSRIANPISISLTSDGSYVVDWGDGIVDSGVSESANTPIMVSHTWKGKGDYTVLVTTSLSNSTTSYSFSVRVLE